MGTTCAVLLSELRRLHSGNPINLDEIRWLLDRVPRIQSLLDETPSYYFYFEMTESSMTVFLRTICALHCQALAMDPPSMLDSTLLFLLEYHMHFTSFGVALTSPVMSVWQAILTCHPDLWKCLDGLTHKPRVKALAKTFYPHATNAELDMILRETIWDVVVWLAPLPDKTYEPHRRFLRIVHSLDSPLHDFRRLPSNWMLVGSLLSNSEALPFSHTYQPPQTNNASDEQGESSWVFCQMQMLQLDKSVLRNRFRHPILNALKQQKKDETVSGKWNWNKPKQAVSHTTAPVPVLQLCFKKILPPSVLSMATSILVCLCPHSPIPPPLPPSSEFDEFDDPEEMALLASLDVMPEAREVVVQLKYHHVLGASAEAIFKILRVSLQKFVLHQYESTAALTAIGVLLAHVKTFQWDILQASSKGPAVFVFPRVLSTAISNCPTNYIAQFLSSHTKGDVALLRVWLLTLIDPCPLFWDALTGHLASLQSAASLLQLLRGCMPPSGTSKSLTYVDRASAFQTFCANVVERFNVAGDQANALRSVVLDMHHGLFAQWVEACSVSLKSLCSTAPPDWKYIHALFDDSVKFRRHDKELLQTMATGRKSNTTLGTIQYCRAVYAYLSSMFRLWGPLTRGTQLVFATFLQEFFPSVAFAQHDHAAELLFASTQLFRTKPMAKAQWFGSKLDKAWVSAVETLRTFFSMQAMPSLFDWIASVRRLPVKRICVELDVSV
ncbi:hypothetical protein DYB32_004054 [Aphanomyces invadans]|uniref:Uncharacterized protein n=1 Tax=Aphanomyces invadans TaxID=157072 RepID=A0A3R7D1S1_9STRA|nr:hypothetical protein DYB32_004054 [Aphanomyces invadans]